MSWMGLTCMPSPCVLPTISFIFCVQLSSDCLTAASSLCVFGLSLFDLDPITLRRLLLRSLFIVNKVCEITYHKRKVWLVV